MHAALLKLGYETGMQGQSCEKVQYESEVLGNEPQSSLVSTLHLIES